ncbi:trypco2 family protein [Sphingobium sp. Ant17]|uniref:trypco2 family protein n=1 Tax=Sphingobium sp. Ant17 TaxID=1461752 RepID=UPI0005BA85D7|nr:trypco2 family protein [Sphingobium sp. Ant17]
MTTPPVDNDELAAFVASTLRAISIGVRTAQPDVLSTDEYGETAFDLPDKVAFDIAVTAKRNEEIGGGLKVQVFSIGGKAANEDQTVSRITFEVPWHYVKLHPASSASDRYRELKDD